MIKSLLPIARAWRATANNQLRQFLDGIEGFHVDVVKYVNDVWLDLFPSDTRDLGLWEAQFALPDTGLSDADRRDRLDAAWKAQGGQDPSYLQATLQGAGFDVYIHEWWVPGTEPALGSTAAATPRNPNTYIRSERDAPYTVQCGEPLAQCGEPDALCGEIASPTGYLLVNKVSTMEPLYIMQCGEPLAQCGEPDALCGNFNEFREVEKIYPISQDPADYPYYLYIGGATFGTQATVATSRRDEFEELCLKICPAQQALGIMVSYT